MDFDGDNYEDRFVGALVKFVATDKFQTMFENFFITHALEFSDDEEHKLKYYELYQKFHDMFEKQLEIFCDGLGITQSEFLKKCREASVKDKQVQRYMDILLSSVEYSTFVQLMKLMRPVALHRLQMNEAEAKVREQDAGMDGKYAASSSASATPSKAAKEDDDYEYSRAEGKRSEDYESDSKNVEKMSK